MTRDGKTQISSDGLRYKSRTGGSPFGERGQTGATMSCFKCGVHKPRAYGSYKRLAGSLMFACYDCYPPKDKDAKAGDKTADAKAA
jgi:hypothetical protein